MHDKKAWRAAHYAQVLEWNRRWKAEHGPTLRLKGRLYAAAHKQENNARARRWYWEHREEIRMKRQGGTT